MYGFNPEVAKQAGSAWARGVRALAERVREGWSTGVPRRESVSAECMEEDVRRLFTFEKDAAIVGEIGDTVDELVRGMFCKGNRGAASAARIIASVLRKVFDSPYYVALPDNLFGYTDAAIVYGMAQREWGTGTLLSLVIWRATESSFELLKQLLEPTFGRVDEQAVPEEGAAIAIDRGLRELGLQWEMRRYAREVLGDTRTKVFSGMRRVCELLVQGE